MWIRLPITAALALLMTSCADSDRLPDGTGAGARAATDAEPPDSEVGDAGTITDAEPRECEVGSVCGSECVDPSEAWCHLCGDLRRDEQCRCIPDDCGAIEQCDAPGPAAEGEFCGNQWWCKRDCADGLVCAALEPCAWQGTRPGRLIDDLRRICRAPEDVVEMDCEAVGADEPDAGAP